MSDWWVKHGNTATWMGVVAAAVSAVIYFAGYWHTKAKDYAEEQRLKTYGACNLKPQPPANFARLNTEIHEGEAYAKNGRYDLAAHKFTQVIQAEPYYLGAHQNLGVVQLAQRKLKDAQVSFDEELRVIDCLQNVDKSELWRFAYWTNGSEKPNPPVPERLNKAEDSVHYNLACLLIRMNEPEAAVDELEKAAKYRSISHSMVEGDEDLKPIRRQPKYRKVLSLFS